MYDTDMLPRISSVAISGSSVGTTAPATPTPIPNNNLPTNNKSKLPEAANNAPTIVVTQGADSATTESADVKFTALDAGQVLAMAGLTFTAGIDGASAQQVATAFSSITDGILAATLNTQNSLGASAGGTFTSGAATGWTSGVANDKTVTFSSTSANQDVTNLKAIGTPSIVTTQGIDGQSSEQADITFAQLLAGQTITLAGLTFTAGSGGASGSQIALAFSGITSTRNTANTLNEYHSLDVAHGGTFTAGTATGWISGLSSGSSVTFTSSTLQSNVVDLAVNNLAEIKVFQGRNSSTTESATVNFTNLTAGQTLTLAGLTFTAGAGGANAIQVANAFANLANHASAASLSSITNITNGGTFTSGTLGDWSTGSNNGSNVVTFTSTNPNMNVTDLVVAGNSVSFRSSGAGQNISPNITSIQ
jgi:S-layer protein